MIATWNRKPTAPAAGLVASLLLAVAGCGGPKESTDDAIVVPEPGVGVTAPVAGSPAAATPAATTPTASVPTKAAEPTKESAAPTKAEGWGTLKGRVVFGGTPPEPKTLVKKGDAAVKDPTVCAVDSIPSQRLVVDKASKGVKYALVYIPKPTAIKPESQAAALKKEVVFDQAKCVFEPHVLGVLKGGKVLIKQTDKGVNHNVNSKLQNTRFNSSLGGGQALTVEPKAAERLPGQVVCDIHPWMSAYWLVADSPYFAVTDEKGNFEIKDVPAGTQKVVVWQEATGPITPGVGEAVEIKANGETTRDYTIDPGKVRPEG